VPPRGLVRYRFAAAALTFVLIFEAGTQAAAATFLPPPPAMSDPPEPVAEITAPPSPPPTPVAAYTPIAATTLRVSESTARSQGNGRSGNSFISDDGRFVTFESDATNLVSGDTNGVTDVFVRDLLTAETTRVSVSSAGVEGNDASVDPSISGDGRFVIFRSHATNLVSGDTNTNRDVFVHDRATGTTTRESVSSSGTQGNGGHDGPFISRDGRYLAFSSNSSNLVSGDTNNVTDIFVRDRATGTTTRVSVSSAGAQANQASKDPALSADGQFVVFDSTATNLVSGDTNARRDLFRHDRTAGTTIGLSLSSSGSQSNGDSEHGAISDDGSLIAFASVATGLVTGDTNGLRDVFVRDVGAGSTTRVSVSDSEAQATGGASDEPAISADGLWVVFDSAATNLVSGDTNAKWDVFVRGTASGTTTRASVAVDGAQGNDDSRWPDIGGADGSVVVFASDATNLVSGDTNGAQDVFVRQPGDAYDFTNLGLQAQHTLESWDLGAGDTLAVNVATGNLVLTHPMVTLPIRGSALSVELTYNSGDAATVGLGRGWRLNLSRRLLLNVDGSVTYVDATGARHTFTSPVTVGQVTTYTRPDRLYATLVRDAGQSHEYRLTFRDLAKDTFDITGTEAILVRSEDRFGNGVDLAYSGGNLATVTDPASRQLTFTWDTAPTPDRLTSFTDWAWIDGNGVVQTTATGSQRQYRFFYDSSGRLSGWSDPLNTSGSCPTGGSHLTCLTYTGGQVSAIGKTQTYTTYSGGTLGTATRAISTEVAYAAGRVATVTDAEQVAQGTPARTTFTWSGLDEVTVDRPTTTTRYVLVDALDRWARVESAFRVLDESTEIERRTTWDGTYPIEPAALTDNAGAVEDAPARTVSYTYVASSLGLLQKMVEPLTGSTSRWTEHTYNANNDITQTIVSLDGSSSIRTITRFCHDASCTLTGTGLALLGQIDNYVSGGATDEDTNVAVEFVSDAYGQRTRVIRHNRSTTGATLDDREDRFTFDVNGNLTAEVVNYANGTVTSPGDDITPNATTQARTDLTTSHTYDTAGNRVCSADPRRAIESAKGTSLGADDFMTRWTFDALNQRLTEKTPTTPGISITQKTATSSWDELGAVRSGVDFGGLVTATTFDRAGRTIATYQDPVGEAARQVAAATFDPDGRILTAKDERQVDDANLGATAYDYDGLGRQTSLVSASGSSDPATTATAFDGLDRRVSYEVGVGSSASLLTVYSHDLGGRVAETDDGFACTRHAYDYRDLATSTVEGLASGSPCTGSGLRTITHSHDGLGRLVLSEVTDGQGDGDKPTEDIYDAAGNRRSSAATQAGTTTSTTFTLNLLDQVTVEQRSNGAWAKTNHDPVGNPTDRCLWPSQPTDACLPAESTFSNPQPTSVTSTGYDARNQRISLVDAAASQSTTYDPDHNYQIAAVYLPTGGTREHQTLYGYDPDRHRLVAVTHQLCAVVEHPCSSGNILQATGSDAYEYDDADSRTRVTEANGTATSDRHYCYDAHNRVVATRSAAGCSSGLLEAYTYDDAGNRLSAGSVSFSYAATGPLTGCSPSCGTVAHDSAGRLERWNGWFFEYDAEGRMIWACQSSSACTGGLYDEVGFTYDGEGHRTQIRKYASGNPTPTATWDFRYQGEALVEERLNGTVVRTYVVDAAGAIVTMTIPAGQPEAGRYLVTWSGHGDALGLWRIEGSGALTLANSYAYTTWGSPTTTTHNGIADLGFRFLYVGRHNVQWDTTHGLDLAYMHARHYAPSLGRFLQPDPVAAEANAYAYTENGPVSRVDPGGTRNELSSPNGGGGGGGGGGLLWILWWLLRFAGPAGLAISKHASDQMRVYGINAQAVWRIIQVGTCYFDPLYATVVWLTVIANGHRVGVVQNPKSGVIVSVLKGRGYPNLRWIRGGGPCRG
jgi:RHS repeat-associated protein